jgi:uncharacterized membrane protein YgcG
MKLLRQSMALILSWALVLIGGQSGFSYQADPAASQPAPQALQQTPEELQELVAPIALYPDALIAQILAAAAFPEQIVEAQKWLAQNKDLQGSQLAQEVDKQPWDASVKALTQFPAVLANMNQNLAWTSELGDAHLNQQQEVSQAIQTMRARAKQAGNLQTTSQEKVSTKGQNIVIEPSDPEVVYVPEYDPWLVYGYPLAVFPGWYPYPGLFLDGPGIAFGLGFGVGLFAGFGWGWHGWGYDWHHGGRVEFNHNTYISHSRTIVNRNGFEGGRANFNHGGDFGSRGLGGRDQFRGNAGGGMHSGAFSGFDHGGMARANSFRGQSSFGGFHGGGFGGGGFHGGGGGFHGGGGRR